MLAILSDLEMMIRKKEAEQAQARLNEIYRNGLGAVINSYESRGTHACGF